MRTRFVVALAAVLCAVSVPVAFAQTPAPSATAAPLPTMPPNTSPIVNAVIQALTGQVKQAMGWDNNNARGTVTFFHRFDMQLRFPNGQYRAVHLHQGTIINPRGATIQQGQYVVVHGSGNADGSINANEITIQ